MNKAKMTFRFDDRLRSERKEAAREEKREAQVTPLHAEGYEGWETFPEKPEAGPSWRESGTYNGWQAGGRQPEAPYRQHESRNSGSPYRQHESHNSEGPSLNEYTADFGEWKSPFDAETERIERLVRRSGGGITSSPETGYAESGEHLRDHRWYEPEATGYYVKPTGGSWLKIVTSVAGAVITGVAFGFFVLSMFTDPGPEAGKPAGSAIAPQPGQTEPAGQAAATAQETAAGSGGAAADANPAAGASVKLPAKTYVFLQGGVFSSAEGAETAQADFRKQGLAAAADSGDKYPVYVGMALNRDEALGLTQVFKQRNIDVVVKELVVPSAEQVKWSGPAADTLQNYLSEGAKMVQLIAAETIAHAAEEKPTPLNDSALQSIKSTHQSWLSSASPVAEGLGESGKSALPRMNSALNTAVVSLEEYKKNPSASFIWQAQSALMQYVLAEKELIQAIAVR